MTLNNFKYNHLMPLHAKGLRPRLLREIACLCSSIR